MRLGITGGMGCGKSTVAGIFKEQGYVVIDTDEVAHNLLKDKEIQQLIRQQFGEVVFVDEKTIDRKKLAQVVFESEDKLVYLENLLHPKVIQTYLEAFALHPEKDFLVQIPLLFEKKLENHFNYVISVSCSDALVVERLTKRGLSLREIQARTKYQLSEQEKARRADFLIKNDGSLEALYTNTILLIQKLKSYG